MTDEHAAPDRLTVYGADWCRDCIRSKRLLDRLGVEYVDVDLVADESAVEVARSISGRTNIPVIVFPGGGHLVEPSDRELEAGLRERALLPG